MSKLLEWVESRIVGGMCIALLCLACGSDQEELILEREVVQLPSVLAIETQIFSNTCGGVLSTLSNAETVATLVQDGNDLTWTQVSTSEPDGTPLVLDGRICALDDANYEIRLRGRSTVRIADGDIFCRTTLNVPAVQCEAPAEDICEDPFAIVMSWDACSQSFNGQFPVGVVYEEAVCTETADCSIGIQLTARLSKMADEECEAPRLGVVECVDGNSCVCESDPS